MKWMSEQLTFWLIRQIDKCNCLMNEKVHLLHMVVLCDSWRSFISYLKGVTIGSHHSWKKTEQKKNSEKADSFGRFDSIRCFLFHGCPESNSKRIWTPRAIRLDERDNRIDLSTWDLFHECNERLRPLGFDIYPSCALIRSVRNR